MVGPNASNRVQKTGVAVAAHDAKRRSGELDGGVYNKAETQVAAGIFRLIVVERRRLSGKESKEGCLCRALIAARVLFMAVNLQLVVSRA